MADRRRPSQAKRPQKARQEDMTPVSGPGSQDKNHSEGKQNGIVKEQKPKEEKKMNPSKENPCQQKETTKHEKASVKGKGPQTSASRVCETQLSANGIKKTEPETPKDTTSDLKMAKPKKSCEKAKSAQQSTKEMVKEKQETQKDTKKDQKKVVNPKPLNGNAATAHKFIEKTKSLPDRPERAKRDSMKAKKTCADKTDEDSILYTTLENLKIKRKAKSESSEVINKLIRHITTHMKENTKSFKQIEEPLRTGSYYENLKISSPDEFDVMFPIPVDRVDIEPFGDDGAFYSVALKRGTSHLKKFQETGPLSASQMLQEFREEVKKCKRTFTEWKMDRKKNGCPAVTLTTTVNGVTISLDVVLSIVVKSSWPEFTKEGLKVDTWLGKKVKQTFRWKPYYLVPKFEGKAEDEKDGVLAKDVWRVSFSHIEKEILKNHGSQKTCCEKDGVPCCRKDCLKLLKHLLSLLKEKNSSFKKFCSYHAKTTLLHACCSRTNDSDWRASDLSSCFRLLLKDFVEYLEKGFLQNFFIPSQNLLFGPGNNRCRDLARCIREECDNGFPIFK